MGFNTATEGPNFAEGGPGPGPVPMHLVSPDNVKGNFCKVNMFYDLYIFKEISTFFRMISHILNTYRKWILQTILTP